MKDVMLLAGLEPPGYEPVESENRCVRVLVLVQYTDSMYSLHLDQA